MPRHTFAQRKARAKELGLTLERDRNGDHPYCLWVNSPTGAKEIWIRNLSEEYEMAESELLNILEKETYEQGSKYIVSRT